MRCRTLISFPQETSGYYRILPSKAQAMERLSPRAQSFSPLPKPTVKNVAEQLSPNAQTFFPPPILTGKNVTEQLSPSAQPLSPPLSSRPSFKEQLLPYAPPFFPSLPTADTKQTGNTRAFFAYLRATSAYISP